MLKPALKKRLKYLRSVLASRWALSCIGMITLQLMIEASSTIWLVTMMKRVTEGQPFFLFLFLYLGSLAIPYLPGCIANIIKISWKQESQRSFIHAFIESNQNQIGEWSNKGIREEKLSILTAEGPTALHLLIDYLYDLYYYSISVVFSIITLSAVIEPLFSIAYLIGILAVVGVMQLNRRKQQRLTQKALAARIDLSQMLLAAWDNVLLGNRYNFLLWHKKTDERVNRCLERNVDLERFDQFLAMGVSFLISIPCLGVAVHYVYRHRASVPDLSAFFVTLPILFVILYNTYQSLTLMFRWGMHKSKLLSIYKAMQPVIETHHSIEKKVSWSKLRLYLTSSQFPDTPHTISGYEDVIAHTSQPGRLTLRGENGAGKSTLLMLIKHHLGAAAFFLPTQNQLSFLAETNKYSTGESLRNRLIEILEEVDGAILLLDEWDANLDAENREKLTLLIDELAKNKCVIEVRHR